MKDSGLKRLWAPWRMEYLQNSKVGGCIFCDKAADERDRENLVLYRGRTAFIMLNLYPYTNGHLMVVPYQHVGDLEKLDSAVQTELMELVTLSVALLRRAVKAHGFNIGMNIGKAAGAGFDDHLHIHVVPRWLGDTNFMPVLAQVRTMPELLTETYDRLKNALQAMETEMGEATEPHGTTQKK